MKTDAQKQTILLAAGGTGGHIFPALALAETLIARGYAVELVADARFHKVLPRGLEGALAAVRVHTIRSGTTSGGMVQKLKAVVYVALGTVQSLAIIRRLQPLAVVGFGGYPSLPAMLAGILLRRRTILHEQNAVLGRVNRLLAPYVQAIAVSYPELQKIPPRAAARVHYTGNPVRASVAALATLEYTPPSPGGVMNLLVLGGSLGASVFAAVLPAACALLLPEERARLQLTQQCREGEIEATQAQYAALGMAVELAPFFTDVAARLASAHCVIARAGASTIAELTLAARPALLVPLPIATDDHQFHNAQTIVHAGGGWVLRQPEFTAEALAARLQTLLAKPESLTTHAASMRTLATPNAAATLAEMVVG